MEYEIGKKLIWIPESKHDAREGVTVTELRSRGQAKLSNGWTVDAWGIAESTNRVPGGRVVHPENSMATDAMIDARVMP